MFVPALHAFTDSISQHKNSTMYFISNFTRLNKCLHSISPFLSSTVRFNRSIHLQLWMRLSFNRGLRACADLLDDNFGRRVAFDAAVRLHTR